MKRKIMLVVMALLGACCLATTGFATQWYDFSISGDDLVSQWSGDSDLRLARFGIWEITTLTDEEFGNVIWGNLGSTSEAWVGFFDKAEYPNWQTKEYDYINGLVPDASNNVEYTFTLGLSNDFDKWYNGVEGSLQFRFTGFMVSDEYSCPENPECTNNIIVEKYDGVIPKNEPVPEPATMLLFGVGLAGVAGFGQRKSMKKNI